MSPEVKAKIPCSRWCCIGMVVITIVVISLVVKVFQEDGGAAGEPLNGDTDSELTARRVDRLTFFNCHFGTDGNGDPVAERANDP